MRATDLPARFGGEEFCFLSPETTSEKALLLAERLRTSISALRFEADLKSFNVTVSLGISEYMGTGDSFEKLLARSDEAYTRQKKAGETGW